MKKAFKQKIDSCEIKSLFRFYIILNFLRQCSKTIHGRTHHNKIKKPCGRQLPISKSLLPCGHRDSKKESFRSETKKVNTTIEFSIFALV